MNKKYILFDLDGTIIDPKAGITKSVQYSLRSFGIHIENIDELTPFIGPPLRDSYKIFYGFNDEACEKAVEEYRKYFTKQGIFENTLYDGMENLLKSLYDNGKTLILATSKPAVFAEEILRYHKLEKYFTFISGSELDGKRSKKEEVIRYAFENINISTFNDAVMIGDREHDIIGAKKVGIESIGVLFGYGSLKELTDIGADYIAQDIEELLKLLSA